MIMCHINNIENKCHKDSEEAITLGCKSRNDTFKEDSELRLENEKSLLHHLVKKTDEFPAEVLEMFLSKVANTTQ